MKPINRLIIAAVICVPATGFASGVTCPTTVVAGKPLVIKAEFTNDDCQDDIVVKNTVLTLLGNSGSAIGLQGPFVTPKTALIPHATCQSIPYDPDYPEYGSYIRVISEGSLTLENLTVIKSVPTGMKGKLAVASAGVLDEENGLKMAGNCLVTVK